MHAVRCIFGPINVWFIPLLGEYELFKQRNSLEKPTKLISENVAVLIVCLRLPHLPHYEHNKSFL